MLNDGEEACLSSAQVSAIFYPSQERLLLYHSKTSIEVD